MNPTQTRRTAGDAPTNPQPARQLRRRRNTGRYLARPVTTNPSSLAAQTHTKHPTPTVANAAPLRLVRITTRTAKGDFCDHDVTAGASWPTPESPVRRVASYQGQQHFSGLYWAATTETHIAYWSRLERIFLMLSDYDSTVSDIATRPFKLHFKRARHRRQHVPGFCLGFADGTQALRDVCSQTRLADPEQRRFLAEVGAATATTGMSHEVWTPDANSATYFANVTVLARFRNRRLFAQLPYEEHVAAAQDAATIADAEAATGLQTHAARALVKHMLWRHDLETDLHKPLASGSLIVGTQR